MVELRQWTNGSTCPPKWKLENVCTKTTPMAYIRLSGVVDERGQHWMKMHAWIVHQYCLTQRVKMWHGLWHLSVKGYPHYAMSLVCPPSEAIPRTIRSLENEKIIWVTIFNPQCVHSLPIVCMSIDNVFMYVYIVTVMQVYQFFKLSHVLPDYAPLSLWSNSAEFAKTFI